MAVSFPITTGRAEAVVRVRVGSIERVDPRKPVACTGNETGVLEPASAMVTVITPALCWVPSETMNWTLRSVPAPVPVLR